MERKREVKPLRQRNNILSENLTVKEYVKMANTIPSVDTSKANGKPTVDFSPEFHKSFAESIEIYDDTLNKLKGLVQGKGFTDDYGVCNVRYQMIYLTPKDLSSYISYLVKALTNQLIECNVSDLERFSVEMTKRFVLDNGGKKLANDNLFATSTYVDPRTQTLMDILVQTQNTFFDRAVYSKYEMTERAKALGNDLNTFNSMHFGPAMKAVVDKLPSLIKSEMGSCDCALVTAYIETFILFMCSLNTCTLNQMAGYVQPRHTFLTKEKPEVTQESMSVKQYAPLFILLTSEHGFLANSIQKITDSKYSHCSLSFDADMKQLFSYGARLEDDPDHKYALGVKRETLQSANIIHNDILVYGFYLPKEIHERIRCAVVDKYMNRDESKFDVGLLLKKAFNDDTHGSKNDMKKICTTFTNDMIRLSGTTFSEKDAPSPQQMKDAADLKPDQCCLVYEGNSDDYDAEKANKIIRSFARKKASKPFVEYTMECCLHPAADIVVHNRIPFDINMRNIVLGDATPNFKDTKSALHFMLKDSRSPIHGLLIKFATSKTLPSREACTPCMSMFEPYLRHCGDGFPDNGREWLIERTNFITDVNWLDKIAYGNQFLDGNYRLDALGNENRHPIVQTLANLHRMYCGCLLKTNEELADNIMNIAAVMHHTICMADECNNRQLLVDILATLGDCFTRNVIRLYHNNTAVIVYDDNMEDTMIPGFQFCEEFYVLEEDANATPKPTVNVTSNGQEVKTAPKNFILSKLANLIRKFSEWLQKKFANVPNSFTALNGPKIAFIKTHQKLNVAIGDAMTAQRISINLTNFPHYKIPAKEMLDKSEKITQKLDEYIRDKTKPVDVKDIEAACYPGDDATAKRIAEMADDKEKQAAIGNYILFGNINPTNNIAETPMKADFWKSMVDDLTNSQKLIESVTKGMYNGLKKAADQLQKLLKEEEAEANKAKQQMQMNAAPVEMAGDVYQENGEGQSANAQPNTTSADPNAKTGDNNTSGQSRTKTLYDTVQKIMTFYQMRAVNLLTKKFFDTYYDAYKKIVDAYQTQTKNTAKGETPAQTPAQTPEQPAETPTPAV